MIKTHWLQYKNSNIAYLSFEEKANDKIQVKGPVGMAFYIDTEMGKPEARNFWRTKIKQGYHQISTKDAPNTCRHNALTYGR